MLLAAQNKWRRIILSLVNHEFERMGKEEIVM
jgi:hypothetical protein